MSRFLDGQIFFYFNSSHCMKIPINKMITREILVLAHINTQSKIRNCKYYYSLHLDAGNLAQ